MAAGDGGRDATAAPPPRAPPTHDPVGTTRSPGHSLSTSTGRGPIMAAAMAANESAERRRNVLEPPHTDRTSLRRRSALPRLPARRDQSEAERWAVQPIGSALSSAVRVRGGRWCRAVLRMCRMPEPSAWREHSGRMRSGRNGRNHYVVLWGGEMDHCTVLWGGGVDHCTVLWRVEGAVELCHP